MPDGISKLSQFQNFILAIERAGWSTNKIEKILGMNWYLFFKKIWKQKFFSLTLSSPPHSK